MYQQPQWDLKKINFMGKKIFVSNDVMTLSNFELGHSVLTIKSLDSSMSVVFEGTYYFELPRMLKGIEIIELTTKEIEILLNRRKTLQNVKAYFFKIKSLDEDFIVVSLNVIIQSE